MLRLRGLRGSNKKGFLLLEVLVSVVAITVGLVYVIRSFSISTRAIATSRDYTKAVSLMEDKLWEIEQKGMIETGEDEGYFGNDRKFSWKLSAEAEEELPVNKTELVVSWKRRGGRQRISAATYLWNEED